MRVALLVNLGLFNPVAQSAGGPAHFVGDLIRRFAGFLHNPDGFCLLFDGKVATGFWTHVNILPRFLHYRLFGYVHFFEVRSKYHLNVILKTDPSQPFFGRLKSCIDFYTFKD